jgi:hypothetical protein
MDRSFHLQRKGLKVAKNRYVGRDRDNVEPLVDLIDDDDDEATEQTADDNLEQISNGDPEETYEVEMTDQEVDNRTDETVSDDTVLNKYEVVFINALDHQKKFATVDAVNARQASNIIAEKRHNVILSVKCVS